jgi:transcriptional regulator with XRE-family HTH domain
MQGHNAQPIARADDYPLVMAQKRPRTRETIARNLRILMDRSSWSQRDMAAKSGVSQRQISNILQSSSSCSTETADALAKAFGLEGWHLMLPRLPLDLVHSTSIQKLVIAYTNASETTRAYMDSIVEREGAVGAD